MVQGGDVKMGKNHDEAFHLVTTHEALESFCFVIGLLAYVGVEAKDFGYSGYAIYI